MASALCLQNIVGPPILYYSYGDQKMLAEIKRCWWRFARDTLARVWPSLLALRI